ncbi:YceI family protein [Marinobacterium jannaschii]|uniref:YceI family protein n=1 Tax=Marinobacterium jannaschii TaxID=64970 RepID=UPI000489E7A6|nr:YceI family protein [Marinobacterium jannaschii]
MKNPLALLLPITICCAYSSALQAEWQLDNERSAFYFASIKKNNVFESHRFEKLSGSISDAGEARLEIDLSSVNTNIGIRDQRMREMLFSLADHPRASFSASIGAKALNGLKPAEINHLPLQGQLTLNGVTRPLDSTLSLTRLTASTLMVRTLAPVVIKADDYALDSGVEALRSVANLTSISLAVPVTFELIFRQQ